MQLTETQKSNLRKLAKYLYSLPRDYKHFNMRSYFSAVFSPISGSVRPEHVTEEVITQCGTVACAAGHGPAAGIKPSDAYSCWMDYAHSEFGLFKFTAGWEWCFSAEWSTTDNTPKGAAKRIMYMLEHDAPLHHNYQTTVYENYTPNFEEAV